MLGIVSNMNSSCCDLEGLTHKHDLGNWLKKFMVPGFVHDDIVLEVIMVIGVLATEPRCGSFAPALPFSPALRRKRMPA